jgi:NADH-quinone oxidoreductase subunit J
VSALFAVWYGILALVAAVVAVSRPNPVHALLGLIAMLLALAAAFLALGAGLAAVLQILIYAGAIVVVFVFVVMTLDASPEAQARERITLAKAWPAPAAITLLVILPFLLLPVGTGPESVIAVDARAVGLLLFGPWALVVELASILLLAGLIGVRHIGRRERRAGTPR